MGSDRGIYRNKTALRPARVKKRKDLPYNKWKLHQNGMLLFSFWLLDIVLRLTVKTDGQSSQTVLVLAAFEKRKH